MSKHCEYIKPNGQKCCAYAVNGYDYCFSHEPELSDKKYEAVRKGGQQIKKPRVEQDSINVSNSKDVTRLLNRCINEIRQGELSPKEANTIGYLANIMLASIKESQIEIKLEEITNAIQRRQED